jgi:uncharacterized membrane protein YqjE
MSLDYGTAPPAPSTHDYVYTTLLGVCSFFVASGMISLAFIRLTPTMPSDARSIMLMTLCIEGVYFVAMIAVLLIRLVFPSHRRWPTLGLNIVLLLLVPFGTALGIYGLWKIDKNLRVTPTQQKTVQSDQ